MVANQCDEALWRDAVGYPGYQVHPAGMVRSMRRWKRWRVLRGNVSGALGYVIIGKAYMHRIVAETFIQKPDGVRLEVNHKNGIKTDNRVENLEWVTRQQNCIHKCRELKVWQGERCRMAKLTEENIAEIRHLWDNTNTTLQAMADRFGVNQRTIADVAYNKTWTHLPHATRRFRRYKSTKAYKAVVATTSLPLPQLRGHPEEW